MIAVPYSIMSSIVFHYRLHWHLYMLSREIGEPTKVVMHAIRPKKKLFVSHNPTDSTILPPTLKFLWLLPNWIYQKIEQITILGLQLPLKSSQATEKLSFDQILHSRLKDGPSMVKEQFTRAKKKNIKKIFAYRPTLRFLACYGKQTFFFYA